MTIYLDSSVILRYILNGDTALGRIAPSDQVGTSDLLPIECRRVLQRERLAAHLDDLQYTEAIALLGAILERLYIIELGPAVKQRAAGPFPTVIGTLDAIHLASAVLWREAISAEDFCIYTYDTQFALCARALGIRVD